MPGGYDLHRHLLGAAMTYLLKSKMLPITGKRVIRPKSEAGLFDSIKHHLDIPHADISLTSRGGGVWAVWCENRGFLGRLIELRPREDMAPVRKAARDCASVIAKEGL